MSKLKDMVQQQAVDIHSSYELPNLTQLDKHLNYILRGDGLWEVRNTPAFVLTKKISDFDIVGLPPGEGNIPNFILKHGKIPSALLYQINKWFKFVCDKSQDETYVQTLWDPETKQYINYLPEQTVSKTSVNYKRNLEIEQKYVLVLETHSHNTMGAFFSSVDDKDEKEDRFYGVVGELGKPVEECKMLFSYVCGEERTLIKVTDLFEEPSGGFPGSWNQQGSGHKKYTSSSKRVYTPGKGWSGESGRGLLGTPWTGRSKKTPVEEVKDAVRKVKERSNPVKHLQARTGTNPNTKTATSPKRTLDDIINMFSE